MSPTLCIVTLQESLKELDVLAKSWPKEPNLYISKGKVSDYKRTKKVKKAKKQQQRTQQQLIIITVKHLSFELETQWCSACSLLLMMGEINTVHRDSGWEFVSLHTVFGVYVWSSGTVEGGVSMQVWNNVNMSLLTVSQSTLWQADTVSWHLLFIVDSTDV